MEKHLPGILGSYEVQSLLICRPRSTTAESAVESPQAAGKQGENEAKSREQNRQKAKAESVGQKNAKLNEEKAVL